MRLILMLRTSSDLKKPAASRTVFAGRKDVFSLPLQSPFILSERAKIHIRGGRCPNNQNESLKSPTTITTAILIISPFSVTSVTF